MPRILLQQGTNLVNKFALLLHKCRFAQDSRDKPENDGSWRCWLSICCELFKYPSPARGEVLNNITFKGLDVVRQYAALLERRVQSSTRVRKVQAVTRQTNPIGRSMIEMLGVLAIIGVLSVAGIAGYSKAMTKWKINKTIEQIEQITHGIFTVYSNQKKINSMNPFYYEDDRNLLKSLGIISEDMIVDGQLKNPFGGDLWIFPGTFGSYYKDHSGEKYVALEYWNIPREACMALGSLDWAKGSDTVIGVGISPNTNDSMADPTDCWLMNNHLTIELGDWLVVCNNGVPDEESGETEADRIPLPIPLDIVAEHCNCKDNDCNFSVAFTDK